MPLGMYVGLGPGDIVLDGEPSTAPDFWPMPIVAKRSCIPAVAELLFYPAILVLS